MVKTLRTKRARSEARKAREALNSHLRVEDVKVAKVALRGALREWDKYSEGVDINRYMQESDQEALWSIASSLIRKMLPLRAKLRLNGYKVALPSLKELQEDLYAEDSDMHVSDWDHRVFDGANIRKLATDVEMQKFKILFKAFFFKVTNSSH